MKLLLEKGADVNARGGLFGYALVAAAVKGATAIVKLLLEQGAEVNAHTERWGNALAVAQCDDIVELLLKYGAVRQ